MCYYRKVLIVAVLPVVYLSTSLADAEEFLIKFNCFGASTGCTSEYTAVLNSLNNSIYRWRNWTSVAGRRGSRIRNTSGSTIRSFHVKVRDSQDDTFDVPPDAGGALFDKVWRKKNGKEVIFSTASNTDNGIPNRRYFWSLVHPETPAGYSLRGIASREIMEVPEGEEDDWELVEPEGIGEKGLPLHRFPREYRVIRCYNRAENGTWYLVSNDTLLCYVDDKEYLSEVPVQETIEAGFNSVGIETKGEGRRSEVVLRKNGRTIYRVPIEAKETYGENLLIQKVD